MMALDASTPTSHLSSAAPDPTLLELLLAGDRRACVSFAGQGFDPLDLMARAWAISPRARRLIESMHEGLQDTWEDPEVQKLGLIDRPLDLLSWLSPGARPSPEWLRGTVASQPLILTAQLAHFLSLVDQGLDGLLERGLLPTVTGHSQGILAAIMLAEHPDADLAPERVRQFAAYTLWQGLTMEHTWRAAAPRFVEGATPMVAIAGPDAATLHAAIEELGLGEGADPNDRVRVAIYTTRTRNVLCGQPASLVRVQALLERKLAAARAARKAGRFGGKIPSFSWDPLPVGGAFHHPMLAPGLDMMRQACGHIGFALDSEDLALEVLWSDDGLPMPADEDALERLLAHEFVRPVRWGDTMRHVGESGRFDVVLDAGPGDGIARLSAAALRGYGVEVVATAVAAGQDRLFVPGASAPPAPTHYASFAPTIDADGALENAFTRATGAPPVILPGMTPTTTEAPIVAAAANAGYWAELAGGGQPTPEVFWERMAEMTELLEPGRGFYFNALYLDRHLWSLHLGGKDLVIQARRAGYPILGAIITAGIPPVAEAVSLLDRLADAGVTQNGFKPGTVGQIKQVLQIADAAPQHTIFMHLEGGRAGGHHSWEDLEALLLDAYYLVRAAKNVVLCVGGGVADEARASELLRGTWSRAHGEPAMPVDAVFLGTVCMATLEAETSPQVKAALVAAAGTPDWVYAQTRAGQITSGKSGLNADIHYVDNRAARVGALLDAVAGDADAVAARRDEIVAALDATAKPYFGDLEAMTYADMLQRLLALTAVGRAGRYEDGRWPDRSWRVRFLDTLTLAEARVHDLDEGEFESVVGGLGSLDEPEAALVAFLDAYPNAATERVHPADAHAFVARICRMPGKPVNFVPVIDADVRRWYKADALWQSHDDRFDADQVLIIPGPAAVRGITRADEPVAELLGRFTAAAARDVDDDARASSSLSLVEPVGLEVTSEVEDEQWSVTALGEGGSWFEWAASTGAPAARVFAQEHVMVDGRVRPNPLRRLCRAASGATLELTPDSIVCRPDASSFVTILRDPADPTRWHIDARDEDPRRDHPARLELTLRELDPGAETAPVIAFGAEPGGYGEAIRGMYSRALFGGELPWLGWLSTLSGVTSVTATQLERYLASTNGQGRHAPLNLAFSMAWAQVFGVMMVRELADGLLDLVHLDQQIDAGAAWPPAPGVDYDVTATMEHVSRAPQGTTVRVRAEITGADGPLAHLSSRFFIRRACAPADAMTRGVERFALEVDVADDAAARALRALDGVTWSEAPEPGDALLFEAVVTSIDGEHTAQGRILCGGEQVGEVRFVETVADGMHALARLQGVFGGADTDAVQPATALALGAESGRSPLDMTAFALASLDANPIHTSPMFARLAGFDAPLVHGMWTAGAMYSAVVRQAAGSDDARLMAATSTFHAPLALGAPLEVEVTRQGVRAGRVVVRARAASEGVVVAEMTAEVAAPRTAYVFPGQGIQHEGMGMEGYRASASARLIWDRADRHTRDALGFSILQIVRDNPRELYVRGQLHRHPRGVLHLTQFTQVAMAALARAQVAQMKEAGVYVDDAITAGHSIGEYNALSAVLEILPLEQTIEVVYQRGTAMAALVPRDEQGRSAYAMGVIRPHHAGMTHEQAEALVAEVASATGGFLQIVNYNVRGRQYAVTGEHGALAELAARLGARRVGKPPYIQVPGIDVPFHSRRLRDGVDAFREALERAIPQTIDAVSLVGRYVPNLTAAPFELTREYVALILEAAPSESMLEVYEDWSAWEGREHVLARTMLVELLAWQFASPVRWIETQDLLLRDDLPGALGAHQIIEVGAGAQPTVANMARQTLAAMGPAARAVDILNVEAEAAQVFAQEPLPEVVEEAPEAPEDEAAVEASAPVVVAAPAAQAAPGGAPVEDRAVEHVEGLVFLVAAQASLRPDQVSLTETVDEVFEGVSSRRNQLLMDLGAEFNVGAIDGAHERPIGQVAQDLAGRAAGWRGGPYIQKVVSERVREVFGRAGWSRADVERDLEARYGLGEGWIMRALMTLALGAREGAAARGGDLGTLSLAPTDAASAKGAVDAVVAQVSKDTGVALAPRAASGGAGGAVSAAAVRELEDAIVGADGALMRGMRAFAEELGHVHPAGERVDEPLPAHLSVLDAELGEAFARWVAPRFDARRHVALRSSWAWAHRDAARLLHDALRGDLSLDGVRAQTRRLSAFAADARVRDALTFAAERAADLGRGDLAAALTLDVSAASAPLPLEATRPQLSDDGQTFVEVPDERGADALLAELFDGGFIQAGAHADAWREVLRGAGAQALDVRGRVALMTGASPGSIAVEVLRHLLRGGAEVVVTTTTATRARMRFYRDLYQEAAAPGAVLHVVPCNQASRQDVDALIDWLFTESTETSGGKTKVLKRVTAPDLVLPFGAIKDLTTTDALTAKSEATMRALLVGVERMVTQIARRRIAIGLAEVPCQVILPLSPNHGTFGGDGLYGESKAALEVLMHKWRSEYEVWGKGAAIVGAVIGWVRGTGLMNANDAVAPALEARSGVRTFSTSEMGWLLAGLTARRAVGFATQEPWTVDLSGKLRGYVGLREQVDAARDSITGQAMARERDVALSGALAPAPQDLAARTVRATPLERRARADVEMPTPSVGLEQMIVIVGAGEVGPCGTQRTRAEIEFSGELSPAGVLELAWTTNMVRWGGDAWVDVETGDEVAESDIASRYRERVLAASGIRLVDEVSLGFDPSVIPAWTTAYLDRDFSFEASSQAEAEAFVAQDPERTVIARGESGWTVTRLKGSKVRVPRHHHFDRTVTGAIPEGFDFGAFGIPAEMVENVDRVTLLNLVATVDAWIASGLTPEELLERVHPARVGNTQSSGIGGMRSLHKLYIDPILDQDRQGDILQETLLNVMAAYISQSYVGNYGPMSHPVGACATAALSIESAMEKLLLDKADFVVAGGFDDIGREGMIGFMDMAATASVEEMTGKGLEPSEFSRSNDARRGGFVEGQGGGTVLLTRGDVAAELGLPVLGVIAYAGSFGDGIHRSIPAPGQGILAAAMGRERSPLARALGKLGLTTDDLGVVYKHDTSTPANDVNENTLHQRIQDALGRTPGNPLWVVSQKTLTGHSKGGAAAWQTAGLCQALSGQRVSPNRNLESVDPAMRHASHLVFTDAAVDVATEAPLRAGLVTSLGFGHVGAILAIAHPGAFEAALGAEYGADQAASWRARADARLEVGRQTWRRVQMGLEPAFTKRTDRRFVAEDSTPAQSLEEAAMLLDPTARLVDGTFRTHADAAE